MSTNETSEGKLSLFTWYLPQINESPTMTVIVAEMIDRALKIADESGK